MGLTIAYSLLASLAVALTLVPAMGATALRSAKQKESRWFEKFVNWYEKALRWSLRHRLPVAGRRACAAGVCLRHGAHHGHRLYPQHEQPADVCHADDAQGGQHRRDLCHGR